MYGYRIRYNQEEIWNSEKSMSNITLSNDLATAIYNARNNPANAAFFANNPSNYLIGEVKKGNIKTTDLSAIASTGTFNITTPTGFFNVNSQFVATPVQSRQNSSNPQPAAPSDGLPPSSTNNSSTSTNSLTDSFNAGVHQVESFFTAHPVAIIGIGALIALLVFKK